MRLCSAVRRCWPAVIKKDGFVRYREVDAVTERLVRLVRSLRLL